jgi:hypothetical protein
MKISDELADEISIMDKSGRLELFEYLVKLLGITGAFVFQEEARDVWMAEYPDHEWDNDVWYSIRDSDEWGHFMTEDLIDRVWERLTDIIRSVGHQYGYGIAMKDAL